MSEQKTIPLNADALRRTLLRSHADALRHERFTAYVATYEHILGLLNERDYPDECRMQIAAVLAAAWVRGEPG